MGIFDKAKKLIDERVDDVKHQATQAVSDHTPAPLQGQVSQVVERVEDQVRGQG
jgi:hypothetical protein